MHTPPPPSAAAGLSPDAVRQAAQQALRHHAGQAGNLLPILHALQNTLGCVPESAVPILADAMQLSRAEIHGVISFYPHFRTEPAGRIVLEVCRAESCQAMGGDQLAEHARQRLGCDFHATTDNGQATLEPVYCLGLCAQSPAVMLDGQPYARMTPAKLDRLLSAKGV
jgi:formate dehydrogenase subunit gamma